MERLKASNVEKFTPDDKIYVQTLITCTVWYGIVEFNVSLDTV